MQAGGQGFDPPSLHVTILDSLSRLWNKEIRTMKKTLTKLDFGISNFRYVLFFTFFLTISSVVFSPYTISVDGFSYLKSAEVLFTPDFSEYYLWIREPGYPLFIRFLENIGGLFLVFLVQALFIAFGITSTVYSVYKVFTITTATLRSFIASGVAIVLTAGYASTLLQQATFIALFGFLLLVISRIITSRTLNKTTTGLIFALILFSTLTAAFMGMAIALALFVTLVISRALPAKSLALVLFISGFGFSLVMIPWNQIKASEAPTATSSIQIGANAATSLIQEFDPAGELQELIQTQAALLNLGGELPPSSGLSIANENKIFGAPVYDLIKHCGRFLHAGPADELWGKIETNYDDRCVPLPPLSLISLVNRISHLFYPLVGLALLFSLLLSYRFIPKLRFAILPAFIVLSPYLLLDASISRYGALILPLGSVLLVELLSRKALTSPLSVGNPDHPR